MRYPKGTVHLTREHDYALLRQLARSGFATRSQLSEFMQLQGHGECRRSFNWRLQRLVQHELVTKQTVAALNAEYVYSLTPAGTFRLEGMDNRFALAVTKGRSKADGLSAFHSVELNHIQLSVARHGLLRQWIPEVEIRSANEFTNLGYAKDYDAIVTLRMESNEVTFALEYERSAKARNEYDQIAGLIDKERNIDQFLYLATNEHLLRFVSWSFRGVAQRLYFGLVADWHALTVDMPAFTWRANRYVPLKVLLQESISMQPRNASQSSRKGPAQNAVWLPFDRSLPTD